MMAARRSIASAEDSVVRRDRRRRRDARGDLRADGRPDRGRWPDPGRGARRGGLPAAQELVGEGTLFMLEVAGDSMVDAAICNGDYVVVRQEQTAENGEIVAALIDGEATVKTFQRKDGHVWLLPHNPAYDPIDGTHATHPRQGHRGPAQGLSRAPARTSRAATRKGEQVSGCEPALVLNHRGRREKERRGSPRAA